MVFTTWDQIVTVFKLQSFEIATFDLGHPVGVNLSLSGFVAPSKNVHVKKETSAQSSGYSKRPFHVSVKTILPCLSVNQSDRKV